MGQIDEEEAVERFEKAARERNIRFCYVRLLTFAGKDPVERQRQVPGQDRQRHAPGQRPDRRRSALRSCPTVRRDRRVPPLLFALMGLGVAAGVVWMLRTALPLPDSTAGLLLGILGLLCALLRLATGRDRTQTGRAAGRHRLSDHRLPADLSAPGHPQQTAAAQCLPERGGSRHCAGERHHGHRHRPCGGPAGDTALYGPCQPVSGHQGAARRAAAAGRAGGGGGRRDAAGRDLGALESARRQASSAPPCRSRRASAC